MYSMALRTYCVSGKLPILALWSLCIPGLTLVSVHPNHQKQGIGSVMMELICKEADKHNSHLYVLASPAGVHLYSKFDFKAVNQVNTEKGVITSMLRKSRDQVDNIE